MKIPQRRPCLLLSSELDYFAEVIQDEGIVEEEGLQKSGIFLGRKGEGA